MRVIRLGGWNSRTRPRLSRASLVPDSPFIPGPRPAPVLLETGDAVRRAQGARQHAPHWSALRHARSPPLGLLHSSMARSQYKQESSARKISGRPEPGVAVELVTRRRVFAKVPSQIRVIGRHGPARWPSAYRIRSASVRSAIVKLQTSSGIYAGRRLTGGPAGGLRWRGGDKRRGRRGRNESKSPDQSPSA